MANGNLWDYLKGPRDTNFASRSLTEDIFGRKTGGETGPWYEGGQDLIGGMFNRGGIFDRGNRMEAGGGNLYGDSVGQGPSLLSGTSEQGAAQLKALGDKNRSNLLAGTTAYGGDSDVRNPTVSASNAPADPTKSPGMFDKMKTSWEGLSSSQKAGAGGALVGGWLGHRQAKAQQKGLGVAIGELDPLKGKFMGEHKRQLGLAEAYRPGGKYSQYMAGQMYSQAAESVGQESQRMIASGITSPSMMRAMGRQSRRQTQAAMPGMELQLSQMALPYEKLAAGSMTQYGGVVEQLASLKGARASIDPTASAVSGAMQGIQQAGQMMSSFMMPV